MSPQVEAALIAAGVGVLTVITTAFTQYLGRRATGKQLDRTLTEQRTRTLNERFATAADKLGDDKPPVRLAGVYAMAGLADDWPENRQTCVDVLCAYLRLPYEPNPGGDAAEKQLDFYGGREVRHTVIRVITAHLQDDAAVSWQGLDFDFTGAVFDGSVDFTTARFSGGTVDFTHARFLDKVDFSRAKFSGGRVDFIHAKFSSGPNFTSAEFSGGPVFFADAKFSDGGSFIGAEFSGGTVDFTTAWFDDGTVSFASAEFSGSWVLFAAARFSGGTVDFANVRDWSVPPEFPWTGTPPPGVKLPGEKDQSQA
jgi:Pentapeptide repeats (9 copies)